MLCCCSNEHILDGQHAHLRQPQQRMQLTAEALREVCKQHKQYTSCPELNDVLYLNCKGIERIQNLEVRH